ncbi:MAG: hypothetical protein R3A52_23895 [Polyangiales bacterium]
MTADPRAAVDDALAQVAASTPATFEAAKALSEAMNLPGASMTGHVDAVARAFDDATHAMTASHLCRALVLQASRFTDPDALAALAARGLNWRLRDPDFQPTPEATMRYVVDGFGDDAADRAAMARYLYDLSRLGNDTHFAADVLVSLLGVAPSGRGRRRVDPARKAAEALARLCLHPTKGPALAARLDALATKRGAFAKNARLAVAQRHVMAGDFDALDPLLTAPELDPQVAEGFAVGVHQRIFYGALGEGLPDASWEAAVRERFDAVAARAPKASSHAFDTARDLLDSLPRRRSRA